MQLLNQNMFTACQDGDALCVTTNGIVKWNGTLTMGAGVAKLFKDSFQGIDKILGEKVKESGNQVYYIGQARIEDKTVHLFSFPTKQNWQEDSKLDLIKQSCIQLKKLVEEFNITGTVFIPQPGCGHGRLSWEEQVEPVVREYLPGEQYHICYGAFPKLKLRTELLPESTQALIR